MFRLSRFNILHLKELVKKKKKAKYTSASSYKGSTALKRYSLNKRIVQESAGLNQKTEGTNISNRKFVNHQVTQNE